MPNFELIIEHGRPVAAIIPSRVGASQLRTIYSLLPANTFSQQPLEVRWSKQHVLSTHDWMYEQLRRVPMLPPRGVKLSFVL